MEQAAYELERFAPAQREHSEPRVRVAKRVKAAKGARHHQLTRMIRVLLAGAVVVGLVCAVLYTQATLTELSGSITKKEQALKEERALNAWLTFELDNMTSLKNVEEGAGQLGLQKVGNDQITYYRVEDSNGIQVREDPIEKMLNGIADWFKGLGEFLTP